MRKCKLMSVFVGSALAVLAMLSAYQVVDAGCQIRWSPTAPTCVVATHTDGTYSYQEGTIYYAQDKDAWTLRQALANTIYDNVDNVSVSPSSSSIGDSHSQVVAGTITTSCYGKLSPDPNSNGTSQLNAWDNTAWECSGSHTRTVKPYGGSCP